MVPALIARGCVAVIAVGIARHTNLGAPPRGHVAAANQLKENPPVAPGGCLVIAYLVKASKVPVFIGVLLNVSRQCGIYLLAAIPTFNKAARPGRTPH